jgi:hypothetical protein
MTLRELGLGPVGGQWFSIAGPYPIKSGWNGGVNDWAGARRFHPSPIWVGRDERVIGRIGAGTVPDTIIVWPGRDLDSRSSQQ